MKFHWLRSFRLMKTVVVVFVILLSMQNIWAQNPDLALSKEERDERLKNYNNIFPIWGKKAIERGFDLPYPVGLNLNGLYMKQDILIGDLELSTGDNPLQSMDFISFENARSRITTANARVDLWLFPFLNIYGIFGRGWSTTTVKLAEPVVFETEVKQEGIYYGFGLTGAVGIKRNWLSVDVNWSWTDLEKLDKPVRARVLGLRLGRTFKLDKTKKISIWIGTMNQKIESVTMGSILLSEVIPPELSDKLEDYQNSDWYTELRPPQQGIADGIVQAIIDKDLGSLKVNYGLDKSPATPWNMLLGSNFEINKHWSIRAEAGLIKRTSFFINLNYRFEL